MKDIGILTIKTINLKRPRSLIRTTNFTITSVVYDKNCYIIFLFNFFSFILPIYICTPQIKYWQALHNTISIQEKSDISYFALASN